MSNRRKSKLEKRRKDRDFLTRIKGDLGVRDGRVMGEADGEIVSAPFDERTVNKKVPAVIHWKDWDFNEREDDEIIGETVIYEDGQFDMIINPDISDEAKSVVNFLQSKNPGNFSIAKEE